ncbi:EGF-like domain-containing protein [Tieghemostelium lacteum]|uniref:EGF-like domain-containing protein n=1 Tax=Tieghemostelium lacteum TaxID=361077 RepID=A0A151Z7X9_TIELA|nr:EGF-like domain-containing protein [Tieghemostelium lacteum]|eukprot:KYQ90060.1 EGF-like domain-containing protein [Tieghemostelium lacteum]
MNNCYFRYRWLIKAEEGDADITTVSTAVQYTYIIAIKSDNRSYYFDLSCNNLAYGKRNITNIMVVNGMNIGGSVEYDCQPLPYPLVNINPDKTFKRVNFNTYNLLMIFDLNKSIPLGAGFTVTYATTYQCDYTTQGYRLFSVTCKIIGFSPNELTQIRFGFISPQSKTTFFTYPSFIDLSYDRNPSFSYNIYTDILYQSYKSKQLYYLPEFVAYQEPLFYLGNTQAEGRVIFNNVPVSGSLDTSYTSIFYTIIEGDYSVALSTSYLVGNTTITSGQTFETASNTFDGTPISVNSLINNNYGTSFESTIEISNYLPFTITNSFGSLSKTFTYTYPYGIVGRNALSAQSTLSFIFPPFNSNLVIQSTTTSTIVYNNTVNSSLPIDNILPVVESVELVPIDGTSFIIVIKAIDDSGISLIEMNSGAYASLNAWTLVEGTLQNGTFSKYINTSIISDSYVSTSVFINIYDMAGNKKTYTDYYENSNPIPLLVPLIDQMYLQASSDISFIRYAMNDIDLSMIGCDNTLFVNFTNVKKNEAIKIVMTYGTSDRTFYGKWNADEEMFSVDFYIYPKVFSGYIPFTITYRQMLYDSKYFLYESWLLKVRSESADRLPPLITDISNSGGLTTSAGGQIQWTFPFEDYQTGYKEGHIEIYSDIDPYTPYTVQLVPINDIHLGTLQPVFDVPPNCVTQNFYIESIVLEDLVGNSATYTRGNRNSSLVSKISPLMRLLSQNLKMDQLTVSADCQVVESDFTPPIITSILMYTNNPNDSASVNLYSDNRLIFVNFTVQDGLSTISPRHLPKCYIHALLFDIIESTTTSLLSMDNSTFSATYQCQIDLPYGLGYPSDHLLLSINGFADSRLNFGGYSPNDLVIAGHEPTIPTTFVKQPILESVNPLPNDQSTITVFGYGFGVELSDLTFKVTYQDSTSDELQSVFQSDTFLIADGVKLNQTTFDIKVANQFFESNSLSVEPYVVPFKPQIPCLGNPVCGGPSNGVCTFFGCVCKYPWTSNDCMSQILIIPRPKLNSTDPTIDNEFNTTLPNGEIVNLASLIKIVGLREMSPDNKALSTFQFNSWIFTNTTPTQGSEYQEFQYKTTLDSNGKTSNIKVTIQYFSILSTVYFANQKIQMLPSTIKYRIEMTSFGFTSELNYLQLLMSTSLQYLGDQSSCSFQDQGSIVNSNMDYVRLQINENSLYCRYIKKGIIDNRIQDISNTFFAELDQSPVYLSKQIGINIPYFKYNMLIDPDFSILYDMLPASERPGSVCDPTSGENSDPITKVQLLGIILGCAGFLIVGILLIIIYKTMVNWGFKVKVQRKIDRFIKLKKLNKL